MASKQIYGLNRWWLWLVLFLCFRITTGYHWHIVEDSCRSGHLKIPVGKDGPASAGILRATRHLSYRLRMNCHIELQAPENYGVVISIRMMGLRTELYGTCKDYLKIFVKEESLSLCQYFLDYDEAHSYATSNNSRVLRMLYHTADDLDNRTMTNEPGFQLSFTAFQRVDSNQTLDDKKFFECDNGRIIWVGLTCDGHNNCGDRSDEGATERMDCGNSAGGNVPLMIAGCIMVMLLFIACMATLVCNRKNQRTISLRKKVGSKIPIVSASTETQTDHMKAELLP